MLARRAQCSGGLPHSSAAAGGARTKRQLIMQYQYYVDDKEKIAKSLEATQLRKLENVRAKAKPQHQPSSAPPRTIL
jgi:hypothetical protein